MRGILARLSTIASDRRGRAAVIGAWVVMAAVSLPLQPELHEAAADESETFLVRGSESAAAKQVIDEEFRWGSGMVAVIAYHRPGGITDDDGRRADADATALCASGAIPSLTLVATPYQLACGETDPLSMSPGRSLLLSNDLEVILASVLMADESTPAVEQAVAAIREVVPPPEGDETGLRAYVTGRAGFEADASEAVKGINEILLAVTVTILLLLLLAIYRSPLVALVPLAVVALAYLVAGGLTYGLVAAGLTEVSGQTTAILIVLMFGAGTDYCLLIVARFRDELRRRGDVDEAIIAATRRTGPAILSAGATTSLAMLVLSLADFNATREMGPILALGIAIMVAAGLTLLPAVLAALGRRAFWPAIPRPSPVPPPPPALWRRAARLVGAHPAMTAVAVTALLIAGTLGNLGGRAPLDFTEAFRDPPDSVLGQELIADHFTPGRAAPLRMVMDFEVSGAVVAALTEGEDRLIEEMNAVAGSVPDGPLDVGPAGTAPHPLERSELALFEGYLAIDPFSQQAADLIPAIREEAQRAAGDGVVLVGGPVAENHDTREALARDTRRIVPVSLALIFLILAVMLRAVVMPAYAIATVVGSFGFALGVGSLTFTHLMGQPASDPALPLFAFIFLIGLGIDYNVFLLARIREERRRHGTVIAVTEALERTGGVITSAGLVLAATFSTLMALPIEALFQIGFVIAVGLLADTFLVRALLVPAIAVMLEERNWWPSRPPAARPPVGPEGAWETT